VQREGDTGDAGGDGDEPHPRIGIEQPSRDRGGEHEPGDHHDPDERGGSRPTTLGDDSGEQDEKRRPRGADAETDEEES